MTDVQQGDGEEESTSAALSDTELVIGLVGALGSDLPGVANTLRAKLTDVFDYESSVIGVSGLMRDLDPERDLEPEGEDRRIQVNMDAGRDLNEAWHPTWRRHDALARLSILEVAAERERVNGARDQEDPQRPLDRFAFILRSFKRPDEIGLLRAVYGERFVLFGVHAPRKRRRQALFEKITPSYASDLEYEWHDEEELSIDYLMARDERERGEAGQNVRGTFYRADFFINDAEEKRGDEIERCLRVLFGDYFATPTRDEVGMAHASIAARRSAEPGRQVGSAVTDGAGNVLAVGCNEVPRAFGGQYWPEDDAPPDGREFRRPPLGDGSQRDTNNVQQEAIADDLLNGLRRRLAREVDEALEALDSKEIDKEAIAPVRVHLESIRSLEARETILQSKLGDITEFGRAVHAEMAAITTAARLGIPLQDATLYTTTFPCHNCARHVIATGIRRLVYVAPYAKSKAYELHDDALVVAPDEAVSDKVTFEPFIGVAPRRYAHLFEARDRKTDDGTLSVFKPRVAVPRLQDADPPDIPLDQLGYGMRETAISGPMESFLSGAEPTIRQPDQGSK